MDPFATAQAHLEELVASVSDATDINEATTRLRLIDRLIQDCLAWPSSEVNCERYHSAEYSDYELGSRAVEVIVEAKKQGVHFDLPAGVAGRRVVEIPTLATNPSTKAALDQVAGYCQKRGVPVGAICNGHQLIAFYASRQDGRPPMEGQALVFSSLQEMVDDFPALWANLSREGVASRTLQRLLLGMGGLLSPPGKLSEQIPTYPGYRIRSGLDIDLRMLGGVFIQDIENEDSIHEDFLRECYCNSGALSQYSMVSKEILKNRYDALADGGVAAEAARDNRGLNPSFPTDLVASALTRRPLILLGDVGVGKSMFLKHLLRVEAVDLLESTQIFYVNFGTEPAIETNLEEYVYRRISSQLLDEYGIDVTESALVRAVYNGELNRLRKTVVGELREADPDGYRREEIKRLTELTEQHAGHLKRVLAHLRGTRGTQSVVVLDNIDQRSQEFQDRVFVIAQSLADQWETTVFVSLRPSTFFESKATGALAAYQLRVFTIAPTRVDEVVRKRLEYARGQVELQRESGAFPEHMNLSSDELLAYLDVLMAAFTDNDQLNEMLDNMSGGNLRVALTFLSAFVGSGYVSTERVLEQAAIGRRYRIPLHEFLRSMICGEYDYYDPKLSEICNIFDLTASDGREHFLMPCLLAHVQHAGESAGGEAWVDVQEIFRFGQEWGFRQEQVAAQVQRAVQKHLLEPRPGVGLAGPFRITSIGAYMHKAMPRHFAYLDTMVVDTPIVDPSVRRQIGDARPISDRLQRAEVFLDYLDAQWAESGLDQQPRFDWASISQDARDAVAQARAAAERAAERFRS